MYIEYFGYYHGDVKYENNIVVQSDENINSIIELDNSNIILFNYYVSAFKNDLNARNKFYDYLRKCHENGLKVLVSIGTLANDNFNQEWFLFNSFISKIDQAHNKQYHEYIAGFYFDEPILNNLSKSNFKALSLQVKNDFPFKFSLSILSIPTLNDTPMSEIEDYMEHVSDIGYDSYNIDNWYNGVHDSNIAKIDSLNKNNWAVPAAWNYPLSTIDNSINAYQDLLNWYIYAVDHGWRGILPFTYASHSPIWTGLDLLFQSNHIDNITLKNFHKKIGNRIKNNPPNDMDLYIARQDYSNVQEQRNWQYRDDAGNYYLYWAGSCWKSLSDAWCFIDQNQVHVGMNANPLRTWRAPKDGTIRIVSDNNFKKIAWATCGDGVNIKIIHYNGNYETIYNKIIAGNNTEGFYCNIEREVKTGDKIVFAAYKIVNNSCDRINFNPVILYN